MRRPSTKEIAEAKQFVREHEADIRLHALRAAFPVPETKPAEPGTGIRLPPERIVKTDYLLMAFNPEMTRPGAKRVVSLACGHACLLDLAGAP